MKYSNKEIMVLELALEQLDKYYTNQEETCRKFKWICHEHLSQSGDGYVKNKNVFEIQDQTIEDIKKEKAEAREVIMNMINKL